MVNLKFTVASQTQFESDRFLRCLWSQFRANFSNYGWLYWGAKHQNVIDLGLLNLGLLHPVHILYDYKCRGRINNLFININKEDASEYISSQISKCISNAKRNEAFLKSGFFETKLYSYYELPSYDGSIFKIERKDGTNLILGTSYFDAIDRDQEFAIKANDIKKFLSLAFNFPIFIGESTKEKIATNKNAFSEELNIINAFLEKYDSSSNIYNKVLEAISLYQNGLKIIYNNRKIKVAHISEITDNSIDAYIPATHQELINIQQKINIDIELAIVALISALEVVAGLENAESKVCSTCGQQVYKIANKVRCFSKKFGDEFIEYNIKNAYSIRSQIVHAGILLERNEILQGVNNPRIDLSQNGSLLKSTHSLPELLLNDVRSLLLTFIKFTSDNISEPPNIEDTNIHTA